jgi:hypothetical protein
VAVLTTWLVAHAEEDVLLTASRVGLVLNAHEKGVRFAIDRTGIPNRSTKATFPVVALAWMHEKTGLAGEIAHAILRDQDQRIRNTGFK